MSACRSCGAEMRWVTTRAGKPMPIDPDERSDGNIVIESDGKARVLPPGDPYTGPRYMPHHATCTEPDRWRKKRT